MIVYFMPALTVITHRCKQRMSNGQPGATLLASLDEIRSDISYINTYLTSILSAYCTVKSSSSCFVPISRFIHT
jgi:hypothetical protein